MAVKSLAPEQGDPLNQALNLTNGPIFLPYFTFNKAYCVAIKTITLIKLFVVMATE